MALHGFDFKQLIFAFKLHLKGGNTFEMEIDRFYHLLIVGEIKDYLLEYHTDVSCHCKIWKTLKIFGKIVQNL